MAGKVLVAALLLWATAVAAGHDLGSRFPGSRETQGDKARGRSLFQTSDNCIACHNGLIAPSGEDVSIGADWRGSMMANSARDPYWQAAVRREILDHPTAQAAIEDECSICHMPMTTFAARASGGKGRILDYLPIGRGGDPDAALAADGVSCTVCH